MIVAGKQPAPQYLNMDDAIVHATKGIGIWDWASTDQGQEPDVVMACAGDVPTMEALAAVELLRDFFPDLRIRFVNVVDLMRLQDEREHPHGLSEAEFDALFTRDKPVIFAYHGYPWLIHRLTYKRSNHANLHVRGYKEEGTTTTPFDMTVMNQLDRFNLAMDVIDRVPRLQATSGSAREQLKNKLIEHKIYIQLARRGHGGDPRLAWRGPRRRAPPSALSRARAGGQRRVEQPEARGARRRPRGRRHHGGALGGRGRPHTRARASSTGAGRRRRGRPPGGPRRSATDRSRAHRRRRARLPGVDRATSRRCTTRGRCRASAPYAGCCPRVPEVACFDTTFHADLPPAARTYALPREWNEHWRLRRYGFHGLSHAYAVRRGAELVGRDPADLRVVSCHLGAGASLAAVRDGRCVDTTMGFTPVEGLVMATRSGSVDPGLLLWLLDPRRPDSAEPRRRARAPLGAEGAVGHLGRPA